MPAITMSVTSAIAAAVITAPVVSVEPIITNQPMMVQERLCHNVQNNNNSVIGGVVGALIGSQIGSDNSTRRTMTGVGAVVGSQIYNTPSYHTQCGDSYVQRAIPTVTGYNVTYVLDGVYHTTAMRHNPGSHVTIQRSHRVY